MTMKGKPLAALIVAKAKPEQDPYVGDDGGATAAADEAFVALQEGNRDEFAQALKSVVEQYVNRMS